MNEEWMDGWSPGTAEIGFNRAASLRVQGRKGRKRSGGGVEPLGHVPGRAARVAQM